MEDKTRQKSAGDGRFRPRRAKAGLILIVVGLAAPGGAVGAVAAAAAGKAAVFEDEHQRPDEGGRHRGEDEDVSKAHKQVSFAEIQPRPKARPMQRTAKAVTQAMAHWVNTTPAAAFALPISRLTAAMAATQGV